MDCRQWLERLENGLAGQGLPARVNARLMDELRDHLDDLVRGGADMAIGTECLMGCPEELAVGAAEDYRRTSWVRRHRVLVFGLAPIPLVVLGLALYILAFTSVGYAVDALTQNKGGLRSIPRNILEPVGMGLTFSIRFVPFLILAAIYGWLGVRYRISGWWLAVAVVEVAALAGAATSQLIIGDLPGEGQLMVGLASPVAGWSQAIQLALPLAIGGVFLRVATSRAKSNSRTEQPVLQA